MNKHRQLLKRTFPAQTLQLQNIRSILHELFIAENCPKTLADQWVLAINEACMNIIQHAYGCHNDHQSNGEIIIDVFRNDNEWIFRLTDSAKPVDKAAICSRDLDDIRPGGLGVHFIQEIMDEVVFLDAPPDNTTSTHHQGNILQMKSYFPRKKEPKV
jgi:anti-sigma regulatory factor (Ser/Thr protein kinase)